LSAVQDNEEIQGYEKTKNGPLNNIETAENTQTIEIKKEQVLLGNLLLVLI
jgi:hypothetical protein